MKQMEDSRVWHALPVPEAIAVLQTDQARGLSPAEATRRLAIHGRNELPQSTVRSVGVILLAQFKNLIVFLLLAAAVVALLGGENLEALAILVVIVLNAAIGFLTEWRAEQALSALKKQEQAMARVQRDAEVLQIPAAELVPGDLVVLEEGMVIPADGRMVECARLQVEESALTGESLAVNKACEPVPDRQAVVADRLSMGFMGTHVTGGRGRLLVTATGALTEIGKIGRLLDEQQVKSSPLEKKLAAWAAGSCWSC